MSEKMKTKKEMMKVISTFNKKMCTNIDETASWSYCKTKRLSLKKTILEKYVNEVFCLIDNVQSKIKTNEYIECGVFIDKKKYLWIHNKIQGISVRDF